MEMREWFEYLVAQHNISVTESPFKNFKVGKIATDVSEDEEDKYRKVEGYQKTKDIIDGIVEKHGGYIYVTHEADGNYINYTLKHESEFANAQTLRYGHNLIDLKFTYNTENLVNLLYPVGDDGITLEGNGFPDYIEDKGSQAKYGVMAQTKQFEGIDDPAELRRVAWKYLEKNSDIRRDIEAIAIDMNAVNINSDRYQVGNLVRIKSLEHQLDDYVRITAIRLDLENPEKSEYTLGNPPDDLYHHIVKNQRLITYPDNQDGIIRETPVQTEDGSYEGQFVIPKWAIRRVGQWYEFWIQVEHMKLCPLNLKLSIEGDKPGTPRVRYLWGLKRTRLYTTEYPSLEAAEDYIARLKRKLKPPHPSLSTDDFAAFPIKKLMSNGTGTFYRYFISEYPTDGGTPTYHSLPANYDAVVVTWYDREEKDYELSVCGYYDPANVESTSLLLREKTRRVLIDYTLEIQHKSDIKGVTIGSQVAAKNINALALGKYNAKSSDSDVIVVGNGTEKEPENSIVVRQSGEVFSRDVIVKKDVNSGSISAQLSVSKALEDIRDYTKKPFGEREEFLLSNKRTFTAKADGILNVYGRFGNASGNMYLLIEEEGNAVAAYDMVGTPDAYFNIMLPMTKDKDYTYRHLNVRLEQSRWMPTYFNAIK